MYYVRGTVKKFLEFSDLDCLVQHEFVSPGHCVTGYWSFLRATFAQVVLCSSEEEARPLLSIISETGVAIWSETEFGPTGMVPADSDLYLILWQD
jgi:hypothetical protein